MPISKKQGQSSKGKTPLLLLLGFIAVLLYWLWAAPQQHIHPDTLLKASHDVKPHPLDPLTPSEILKTKEVILTQVANGSVDRFIFSWITLEEPPKAVLLPYFLNDTTPPLNTITRRSFTILIERATARIYEVLVKVEEGVLESVLRVPKGLQPSISIEEAVKAMGMVRVHPEVMERCRRQGFPNMSLVNADAWPAGYIGDRPELYGRRLLQFLPYGKLFDEDNQYAHPFDFIVLVDPLKGEVVAIEELPTHSDFNAANKDSSSVPKTPSNYKYQTKGENFLRKDDKPILISSPEGTAYHVRGNEISWQKFKMRISFNGREGLVLHNLNYDDNGNVRPILYRASLSEMFVPYGDPRPPFHRKSVFDLGEYGIGFSTFSLQPNGDCVGSATYMDGWLNNPLGDPERVKNAICIREEDAGILWKHVDFRTGKGVVVRSHRLAISFIATVGNYEYIFHWHFYQDGSIEYQIQLSGILSVHMMAEGSSAGEYGTEVFPQINAPYHQHYFAMRLDLEVDGNLNSVSTCEGVRVAGGTGSRSNPYGQGITTKVTPLKTAGEARTKTSSDTGKVWTITNPSKINAYAKKPVAWKLQPHNSPRMLLRPDSPLYPKGAFFEYDVWVTPYKEGQLYVGGFYLNNSGLPEWVGQNPGASVQDADIVLWHTFGMTHIPRVEDYPVMPVETLGFWLKPYNFFLENPGLDVPPPDVLSDLSKAPLSVHSDMGGSNLIKTETKK